MIAYLKGKMIPLLNGKVILKTEEGIGYEINFNQSYQYTHQVEIYVTTVIRETSQELFGFLKLEEKLLFELLMEVKGIGPKSAYTIVKQMGAESLYKAIKYEDILQLRKIPGIGPRTAQQIVLDLSSKKKKIEEIIFMTQTQSQSQNNNNDLNNNFSFFKNDIDSNLNPPMDLNDVHDSKKIKKKLADKNKNDHLKIEAVAALISLGYEEKSSFHLISKILEMNPIGNLEELLQQALKEV